ELRMGGGCSKGEECRENELIISHRGISYVKLLFFSCVHRAMTLKNLCILLLLAIQAIPGRAQSSQSNLDQWLDDNTKDMGGRSMLVVWKDGKLLYSRSVNDMTRKQKMVDKYIARRQKKETDFSDYTMSYRQPIASCSKWFSAALVMTFVDEGKI